MTEKKTKKEAEETKEEKVEEVTEDPADEVAEENKESEDDKYKRLLADFQNYKKRVEKEKSGIYAYANESIVSEMLTVLDNFGRGLSEYFTDLTFTY